jgi:hypothetical protein
MTIADQPPTHDMREALALSPVPAALHALAAAAESEAGTEEPFYAALTAIGVFAAAWADAQKAPQPRTAEPAAPAQPDGWRQRIAHAVFGPELQVGDPGDPSILLSAAEPSPAPADALRMLAARQQTMPADMLADMQREAFSLYESDDAPAPADEPPPLRMPLSYAAGSVLAERRRQIEQEGWTPEHDDQHADGELARAAAVYANPEIWNILGASRVGWPWDASWWKPSDQRRNLVKAGALILAEIERLDRIAKLQAERSKP